MSRNLKRILLLFCALLISVPAAYAAGGDFPSTGIIRMGNIRVHFILGNIATQNADAYIVAHFAGGVSEGAAAGAIWSAGAGRGFEKLEEIYASQQYRIKPGAVHVTETGGGKAKYLINVASLKAEEAPFLFNTVEELEKSPIRSRLTVAEYEKYRGLVKELESMKMVSDAFRVAGDRNSEVRAMAGSWDIEREIKKIMKRFEPEMQEELRQVVARAVYDSLVSVSDNAAVKKVAMPVLGTGIMGNLNFHQSWEATLAGLQAYALDHPNAAITDFGIVVYGAPNAKNTKWLNTELKSVISQGQYFRFKFAKDGPLQPDLTKWWQEGDKFLVEQVPGLSKKSVFSSIVGSVQDFCGWFTRPFRKK